MERRTKQCTETKKDKQKQVERELAEDRISVYLINDIIFLI